MSTVTLSFPLFTLLALTLTVVTATGAGAATATGDAEEDGALAVAVDVTIFGAVNDALTTLCGSETAFVATTLFDIVVTGVEDIASGCFTGKFEVVGA